MIPEVNKKELALVIVGSFNPAIISPSWLSKNQLMRESEVNQPNVRIINNNLSIFTAGWLDVNVTHERLQFLTAMDSVFDTLKDLMVSTLSILNHTPVTQFGYNYRTIFNLKTKMERDKLGYKFVPKKNWTSFSKYVGMSNLQVEIQREDDYDGKIIAGISPDISNDSFVHININDHYNIKSSSDPVDEIIKILTQNRKNSVDYEKNIIEGIFNT